MAMKSEDVQNYIQLAIPDAEIHLESLVNDGDHYKVTVVSESFNGLSLIQQHKLVYDALGNKMGNELHALSVVTKIPSKRIEL